MKIEVNQRKKGNHQLSNKVATEQPLENVISYGNKNK